MPNEQSAPNFFAVVNDMAKRFVELMASDYRMKRKVGRNYTNAVASGTLEKSLAYRLKIKGKSIDISIYAKGKASQYFLARENGRRAGATPPERLHMGRTATSTRPHEEILLARGRFAAARHDA